MSIQDNIEKVNNLTQLCENHLIGGVLKIEKHELFFKFHEPHLGLHGVRTVTEPNKFKALERIINKLDELYNKEHGWTRHHTPLQTLSEVSK